MLIGSYPSAQSSIYHQLERLYAIAMVIMFGSTMIILFFSPKHVIIELVVLRVHRHLAIVHRNWLRSCTRAIDLIVFLNSFELRDGEGLVRTPSNHHPYWWICCCRLVLGQHARQ